MNVIVETLVVNHCSRTQERGGEEKLGSIFGKISAQPHPTLCIQFLNRENNDKNNTFPLGKQICFTIVWGCAEILPNIWWLGVASLSEPPTSL